MFKGIVFERILANGSIFHVAVSPDQMRFVLDTGFIFLFVALSCLLGLIVLFLAWMLFRVREQSRNPNVREINVLADLPQSLGDLKQSLGTTLNKMLSVMAMQQKSLSNIRSTQKEHTSYFADLIGIFKSWQNSITSGFDDMRESLAQIAENTAKIGSLIGSLFSHLKEIKDQLNELSNRLKAHDLALATGLKEVNGTLRVIRTSQDVVEKNSGYSPLKSSRDDDTEDVKEEDDFMKSMRAMSDDDDDTGYRH